MKNLYLAVVLCLLVSLGNSQFILQNNQSLEWYIDNVLLGGGVTITNATFNNIANIDSTNQFGFFDTQGNVIFPVNKGLIMATGDIQVAQVPNNSSGATMAVSNWLDNDVDLSMINPNTSYMDVAVLEFDFVPQENLLIYEYSFASEEYPEWVGTTFNDAFGFFVSGPGISGPFSSPVGFQDGSINVATLPDTNVAVSINNVNADSFSQYFILNDTIPPDSMHCQFDGYTTSLPVSFNVIPGQTYHIKMVIGDGSDSAFDSAIFIKNQSFMSVAAVSVPDNSSLSNSIHIFPNPTSDEVSVLSEDQTLIVNEISIFDMNGKLIESALSRNLLNGVSLNITHLATGIYTIGVNTNKGYFTKKLQKN